MLNKYHYIRHYYTLEEIFTTWSKAVLQALTTANTKTNPTYATAFEPVINLIYDKYCDWAIGYIDKCIWDTTEPTTEEIGKIKEKFIRSFATIYQCTSERYLKLLTLYNDTQNKLMEKLTNTIIENGSNRTNDTPQNGGTFEDDEHTSLYMSTDRTTTTTIDPETVIDRLDAIQNKYRNLLDDWVKEFKDLFIIGE